MKDRITAAVLAFFLGGIGVHRFYLGQTGLGFVYLLLCWTFIPLFISFIDFIIFLTQSNEAFNAKYNKNQKIASAYSVDDLEKLARLKDQGAITEDEYNEQKKRILS